MHPLPRLALATGALLLAPALTDAAATALAPVSPAVAAAAEGLLTAEAAFIRRGRLKKKAVTGFKVVVITQWDEADASDAAAESVAVSVPTVEGGGSAAVSGGFRLKSDKHFKGIITQYPATYSFTVTLDNGDGTTTTAEVPVEELDTATAGAETTVVTDLGVKAHLRVLDGDGGLKVRVFHEDGAWDPSTVTSVQVAGQELPYQRTTRRFVASLDDSELPADFGDGSAYTLAVDAFDADGQRLDTLTATQTVGDTPDASTVRKVRVRQTRRGDLKVVTDTEGVGAAVAAVQVAVTDSAGATLVSSLDDMSASTTRLFATDTLTFDDPSSAADQPYGVVLNFYDNWRNSLGSSEYEVVVEGLEVDSTPTPPAGTPITVTLDGEEITGRVGLQQQDATNFALAVELDTDAVASVTFELIDLVGNTPIPEAVTSEVVYESRRWVTKGDAGVGALADGGTATVEVYLLDEQDESLSAVSATVSSASETAYNGGRSVCAALASCGFSQGD